MWGQHVNTTDSAVRIKHLPTDIVPMSNDRSQHKNKAYAMNMLKSRIYEYEYKKKEKKMSSMIKNNNRMGKSIRSYVLHP